MTSDWSQLANLYPNVPKESLQSFYEKYKQALDCEQRKSNKRSEPIIGWRAWQWERKSNYLHSLTRNIIQWPHRRPLQVDDPNWHLDRNNPNGIHAMKLRREILASGYITESTISESRVVFGEVYLWGKVIEHSQGYRAEFAYPKKLFVHPKTDPLLLMKLEEDYGIPVEFAEDFSEQPQYVNGRPGASLQQQFQVQKFIVPVATPTTLGWGIAQFVPTPAGATVAPLTAYTIEATASSGPGFLSSLFGNLGNSLAK